VPGAEAILEHVARLNRHAAANGIPLVSTVDAHAENDPEFRQYPAHCVLGTVGQAKPQCTLVPGQILLPKQSVDCFTSPELPHLLGRLGAERYVVYGVVTEICVMHAAMGLLGKGARVDLVEDAVRHLDSGRRDRFLGEFVARGGGLATVASVVGG
jgi:nicotinamidase/pyrazinamidase